MEKETKSYKTSYTFKACLGPKRHPIITHTRISIYEKNHAPLSDTLMTTLYFHMSKRPFTPDERRLNESHIRLRK